MSASERKLADALQACLEAIEDGASAREALSRQPVELQTMLRPRLQAALTLRAHRPARVPAFDAELRRRLAEVDAGREEHRVLPAWLRPALPLTRAAAVLLAMGLALGSVSFAAASLLPQDHWLQGVVQPINRVREQIFATAADLIPGFASDPRVAPDRLSSTTEPSADGSLPSDLDPAVMGDTRSPSDGDVPVPEASSDRDSGPSERGRVGQAPLQRDPDRLVQVQPAESTPSALVTPIRRSGPTRGYVPEPENPPVVLPPPAQPSDPEPNPPTATDRPVSSTATPVPRPTEPGSTEPAPTSTLARPDTPEPTQPQPTIVVAPTHTPPGPPPMPSTTPTPPATTGVISGRIFDKDEAPVVGDQLWVEAYDACPRRGDEEVKGTLTDRDSGRYTLSELPPGRYWIAVWVRRPGRLPDAIWHESEHRCEDASSVLLDAGGRLEDIDITLRDPRDQSGREPSRRDPRAGGAGVIEPGRPGADLPPLEPEPTLFLPPFEPTSAVVEIE